MARTLTKSIRLTVEESNQLAQLSQQNSISESALMKQWIVEGIKARKLEQALMAFMKRATDLRGGAAMAGVSYSRFMREVQNHNIIIFEDDHFLDNLRELGELFDDQRLLDAVERVNKESSLT